MTEKGREREGLGEEQPKKKDEPKEEYEKPELTKFGPVEHFTGQTAS